MFHRQDVYWFPFLDSISFLEKVLIARVHAQVEKSKPSDESNM